MKSLKVGELADGTDLRVPYSVIEGSRKGPTLYVGAGTHGDELNGIEAARRIASEVRPNQLRGKLIVIPVHNLPAYWDRQRHSPFDGLDMNRVYPGDKNGLPTERMAYVIFNKAVMKADFLIDLHTATTGGENVPFAIIPPPGTFIPSRRRASQEDLSVEMARAFGTKYARKVIDVEAQEKKYYVHVEGELHIAAARQGISSILVELGLGGRLDEGRVELGYRGVLNVMRFLNMMDGKAGDFHEPVYIVDSEKVTADIGGILHLKAALGQEVSKGDLLAEIVSPKGKRLDVFSPIDAIVIRVTRFPTVNSGDRIVNLAVVGEQETQKKL